jgi:hypothetical protein
MSKIIYGAIRNLSGIYNTCFLIIISSILTANEFELQSSSSSRANGGRR